MGVSSNPRATPRILVVDDEPVFVHQTTECLRAEGYDVVAARNGREAIAIADKGGIDLILLDVIMPVLNGVEVTKILKRNTLTSEIPIIVISTMTEYKDRVEFFRIGASDYMPKPIDNGELLARVSLQLQLVKLRGEVEEANRALQQKNRMLEQNIARIEHDLSVARSLQRAIYPAPEAEFPGLSLHFWHESSENLRSDYFDYLQDESGTIHVIIADVSGHGIASALLAAQFKVLFVGLARQGLAPREFMEQVNQLLVSFLTEGYYFTAIYLQYHPARRQLSLVNAGHVPLLYRERAGGRIRQVESTNSPLGFFAPEKYAEVQIPVAPGDLVMLLTDGLTEHSNAAGAMFDIEGVIACLKEHGAGSPRELLHHTIRRAKEFGATPVFSDDLTLGVMAFTG